MATGIQWTQETWNPVTGCSKVSQGCKNCYAERIWKKVYGMRPFTDVQFHEDRLEKPLHWKHPRMIFVNSMGELFHEKVSDDTIDKIYGVMAAAGQHTFQVLTKRPERMLDYLTNLTPDRARANTPMAGFWPSPLPNVWWGVSVENQEAADERIPLLLQTPAQVRWISAEPLLGPIDFHAGLLMKAWEDMRAGRRPVRLRPWVDWIVVGGESGTKAKSRSFDLKWAYDIKAQCEAQGVPLFMKQFGRNPVFSGGDGLASLVNISGIVDSHGGNMNEWPEDLRIREYPR